MKTYKYTFKNKLFFKSCGEMLKTLKNKYILTNHELKDDTLTVEIDISGMNIKEIDKMEFTLSWFDNPEYL